VQPLDSAAIKASFVNMSRSRLASMSLPGDLEQVDWSVLDFLGWRDPKAPTRGYLVVPHRGRTIGLSVERRVTRLQIRLAAFVDKALAPV
jgi:hypothetical protein